MDATVELWIGPMWKVCLIGNLTHKLLNICLFAIRFDCVDSDHFGLNLMNKLDGCFFIWTLFGGALSTNGYWHFMLYVSYFGATLFNARPFRWKNRRKWMKSATNDVNLMPWHCQLNAVLTCLPNQFSN